MNRTLLAGAAAAWLLVAGAAVAASMALGARSKSY
jgi:hypothetical protein